MTVKKFLADLYGCTPGYQYNQLNEERLDKKISYYQNFLETIGKVDPGYTKVRNLFKNRLLVLLKIEKRNKFK